MKHCYYGDCDQPATAYAIGPHGSALPICDDCHAYLFDQASDWFKFRKIEEAS